MSSTLFGTSVVRVEDHHLLVGDTTYVANLDLPGVAEVRFVTSTVAHGEILSIDVEEARRAPGVIDVVTAADLDVATLPGNPPNYPDGTARPVLCSDRVRFVGEPVVAIVAETATAAADAAELVEIDYRTLPAVVDPREALRTETLLFPDLGTNVMTEAAGGDDEPPDFGACEVVVEAELVNQRLAPCPLETRVAASRWTEDGRLVHYASCQGVHPLHKGLCEYYGLDGADVRVVTSDVGGSFGAKARFYPEEMLLPLLARRAGRPVRWVPCAVRGHGRSRPLAGPAPDGPDRRRRGTAPSRPRDPHPRRLRRLSRRRSGDGLQHRDDPARAVSPSQHVHWTVTSVATNTTPLAAYRGAGRPESGALIDRAVDLFAAEIGMDPLEVRRRNLLHASDLPWTNPTGLTYDCGDYHEALEMAVAAVDYDGVRAEQARRREAGDTRLLGIGLSTFIDRTAGIPGTEYGAVELQPDGGLRVLTGSSPYGQGHYTTWAMLVSERTGVPVEPIEVVHGDTDVVPRGGITGGSRSAQKAGSAVAEAADTLVARARDAAATLLEAAVEDVVLDTSTARFHVAGSPAVSVGWADVAAGERDAGSDGAGTPSSARATSPARDRRCRTARTSAVVEVDADTGHVELLRMVTVDDAGRLINPMIVLGQVHGGVAQAIAQALYEEFRYDEDGNPLTASFLDYYFPTAADLPSFECHLTQNPSPQNPLGMKGIAESGTIGGVPAVQNAVVDALAHLGVRHLDLPLSPQRVWEALRR